MRVAILTSGRFHVCDLARELDALGHDVSFYSCVPRSRTRRFGLPDRCNRTLFRYLAPLVVLMFKSQRTRFRHRAEQLLTLALDGLGSRTVGRCDVFIGMSGMSTRTAKAVRRKYGAGVWIERGSRHILSQKEILENMPGAAGRPKPISDFAVQRELADYAMADTVVVPSLHVERSFLERGTHPSKLFRNPYGVDLAMFPPTPAPRNGQLTVITAGTWSFQKGADVLAEAWRSLPGVRLLHVGSVLDAPLPQGPGFEHYDAVPQWRLQEFYAQGHVFAQASRQEGLALVQAQALACGLRLVCTDRTGGEDLREFLDKPELVTVVPVDDAPALARGLSAALKKPQPTKGLRDYLGNSRAKLSWRAYGERYHEALVNHVPAAKPVSLS